MVRFWVAVSLALCAAFAPMPAYAGNEFEGHWEGVMVREGASLPVSFDFSDSAGGVAARFNSPQQRALGIPIKTVTVKGADAHLELVGDGTPIIFDGRRSGDRLSGTFREGAAAGSFALTRVAATPVPYEVKDVRFVNGPVTLSGNLLKPKGDAAFPAVIFVHGAGPEGRAASRFLADYLARRGIAALIYDKRGVGQSTGDWKKSDFDALAGDAIAAIELLSQTPGIDPRRIGIYGHSQGGMIAPLIATRSPSVAFVISGAGSAIRLREAEVNSVTNQLIAKGIAGEDLERAKLMIELYVAAMSDPLQRPLFWQKAEQAKGERWYPMLFVFPPDHWFWSYYPAIANYNAAEYWQAVKVPTLLVYGERDRYVPLAATIASADRALNRAGNKDYTILMLPRANHAFSVEPMPGEPFEWTRLAAGYPDLLVAWIRERTRPGKAP